MPELCEVEFSNYCVFMWNILFMAIVGSSDFNARLSFTKLFLDVLAVYYLVVHCMQQGQNECKAIHPICQEQFLCSRLIQFTYGTFVYQIIMNLRQLFLLHGLFQVCYSEHSGRGLMLAGTIYLPAGTCTCVIRGNFTPQSM